MIDDQHGSRHEPTRDPAAHTGGAGHATPRSGAAPGDVPGHHATTAPPGVAVPGRAMTWPELAYVNRATTVTQVLPSIAHEMNNALQVVGGVVELLAARSDLAPDVQEKIARIGAQADRTATMVRDLVAFARRDEAGVRAVDLLRIVERALSMRRYQLARARVQVDVEAVGAGDVLARVDQQQVQQALVNLIINAEHALSGRPDARIRIVLAERDGQLHLAVEDNGPGFGDVDLVRACQPFSTTKAEAAGLGLPIARALAEANRGSLTVEQAPHGGVRATLSFPLR